VTIKLDASLWQQSSSCLGGNNSVPKLLCVCVGKIKHEIKKTKSHPKKKKNQEETGRKVIDVANVTLELTFILA
jgi:hypothetical protein